MRTNVKNAVGHTVQDLIKNGIIVSFTDKDLRRLGIIIPEVELSAKEIKEIREKTRMSQSVFAKILNVNASSVKQWEQGKRNPTGPTRVLLELLNKDPNILNYRIDLSMHSIQE